MSCVCGETVVYVAKDQVTLWTKVWLLDILPRLKGYGNKPFFRFFFFINRFGLGPLQNLSSRSDFDFEFAEI